MSIRNYIVKTVKSVPVVHRAARYSLARIRALRKQLSKDDPFARVMEAPGWETSNGQNRVAFVGLGNQGWRLLQTARNLGYEVVGVCDLDQKKLQAITSVFPSIPATNDLLAIRDMAPDSVVVATLADSHAPIVKGLVQSGIARILVEKPAANTIADLRSLRAIATSGQCALSVYHTALFLPETERIKSIVRDPDLGRLVEVHVNFKSSGFANIGSHMLALLCYVSGLEVVEIGSASFSRDSGLKRGREYFDPNGKVSGRLSNGAHLHMDNTESPYYAGGLVRMHFEMGTLHWHLNSHLSIDYYNKNTENRIEVFDCPVNSVQGRHICLDRALNGLNSDVDEEKRLVSLHAVEVIIAAHVSSIEQRSVRLPMEELVGSPYRFS